MKRFRLFLMTAAFLMLAGCGRSSDAQQQDNKLRVAFFPNITHTQALVMKDKELLEKALGDTCAVEWIDFNAGPSEVEAMFAGEVDIGYIGPVPAVTAYNKSDGDIRIIAGAANGGSALMMRQDAGISKVEELSGKTVAVPNLGNTQHLLLLKVLSDYGLAPKANGGTVDVVPVANADVGNVMDLGQVDAALVPEPWGSTLEERNGAARLLDYDGIWMDGDYSTTVVMVGKDFMENNPELIDTFLDVHKETTEYINDNREEAKEIVNLQIKELTGKSLDDNILQMAFDRIIVSENIPRQSVMDYAQVSLEQGFIRAMPKENLIDEKLAQ